MYVNLSMGVGAIFLLIYVILTVYTVYVVKHEAVCRIYRKFVLILTKILNKIEEWWRQKAG